MRPKSKLLVGLGLIWIAFILSICAEYHFFVTAPYYFYFSLSLSGILFFLCLFVLLRYFFLKSQDTTQGNIHTFSKNDTESYKENLPRLAHYDELTSLPNRIFFNEMLNKILHHAKRQNKMLALLFVDIDRFKNINDAHGQALGDLTLKEVARRFSSILRSGDLLARLDGDEFIILLTDIDHPKFASPVAEKLLQHCTQPFHFNNQEFHLTASIGICIFPDDGSSLEDLQKNIDVAVYHAKRTGGGMFHYFNKEMNVEAHEHIQLEAALHKAIDNHEFVLYYQPKFNPKNGKMDGLEALIRWENPELGLINPSQFIPLAEETGLIIQIGEWVLREACKTSKAWQAAGYAPITISVNISPKQFFNNQFVKLISNILTETQLNPVYLELEMTETIIMSNTENAATRLHQLHQLGVHISIDDFGTGYTSISWLKKFPINVLKIDQTFIKGIPENQNDLAITKAILSLSHSLGIKVVAEGVETAEQLQCLADNDCDLVQGYYLSRPLPEHKIILQLMKESPKQT